MLKHMLNFEKQIDRTIGTWACRILGFLRRKRNLLHFQFERDVHTLLFIKLIAIGDLIVLLPMVKAFKTRFPDKKIIFLASPRVREVVEGQPFIDEILYFDLFSALKQPILWLRLIRTLRNRRVDLALELTHYHRFISILVWCTNARYTAGFDLPGQGKERLHDFRIPYVIAQHEVLNFLSFARFFKIPDPEPITLIPLIIPEKVEQHVLHCIRTAHLSPGSFILIHPGTGPSAPFRRWPRENWLDLISRLLSETPYPIVMAGGRDEQNWISFLPDNPRVISVIDQLSLQGFAHLTSLARMFIGLDTGPTHVAAAMGAKIVALYGPNTPVKWGPWGDRNIAIYKPRACSPCIRQYEGKVESECGICQCMTDITPEDIMSAIHVLL